MRSLQAERVETPGVMEAIEANLFGPGNRPNSTVGRALSLLLWN